VSVTRWISCFKVRRLGQLSESGRYLTGIADGYRYEWLGRRHKFTSSASRFSRYAEEKGVFSVKSVALKDNQVGLSNNEME